MAEFVPGAVLNREFYLEVVQPLLRAWPHSAGLLGWGSDVLAFDDERSTDHGWGPRLTIFVPADDVAEARASIDAGLPETFRGWPVHYGWDATPVSHHVEVTTLPDWLRRWLGHDPRDHMTIVDWLVVPQQQILGIVRGPLYHDGLEELGALREQLAWYPDGVWLWLVACQWRRIAQEEAFVGRTAQVDDVVGSRTTCARLVREIMRLHFLLARTYAPYTKWFGTAYRELLSSGVLLPHLLAALDARDYESREAALSRAYETIGELHNHSGLTEAVNPAVRPFYNRPFAVLDAERFVRACLDGLERLDDEAIRELPLIGSIDQFVDSTDVLSRDNTQIAQRLHHVYGETNERREGTW